jgi:TPR repeat protein
MSLYSIVLKSRQILLLTGILVFPFIHQANAEGVLDMTLGQIVERLKKDEAEDPTGNKLGQTLKEMADKAREEFGNESAFLAFPEQRKIFLDTAGATLSLFDIPFLQCLFVVADESSSSGLTYWSSFFEHNAVAITREEWEAKNLAHTLREVYFHGLKIRRQASENEITRVKTLVEANHPLSQSDCLDLMRKLAMPFDEVKKLTAKRGVRDEDDGNINKTLYKFLQTQGKLDAEWFSQFAPEKVLLFVDDSRVAASRMMKEVLLSSSVQEALKDLGIRIEMIERTQRHDELYPQSYKEMLAELGLSGQHPMLVLGAGREMPMVAIEEIQGKDELLAWLAKPFTPDFRAAYLNSLKMRAEAGDAEAQFKYAWNYKMSDSEVIKWFSKAATQGHVEAQFRLAEKYKSGEGVEMDLNEAVKWYRGPAEQGHLEAQAALAYYYSGHSYFNARTGGVVQGAENPAESSKWALKAAQQGHPGCQYRMGGAYINGYGVGKNMVESIKWYRKAAEQGCWESQYKLGEIFHDGREVPQNYPEAVKWWRQSAEQGVVKAMYWMGYYYQHGHGVTQNTTEAIEWYRKAAAKKHEGAQKILAELKL